jgi:uncharacterized protein YeeX (DUF496 family)
MLYYDIKNIGHIIMSIKIDTNLPSGKNAKPNNRFFGKKPPIKPRINASSTENSSAEAPNEVMNFPNFEHIPELNIQNSIQQNPLQENLESEKKYAQLQSNLLDQAKTGLDKLNDSTQSISGILSSIRQQMKQRVDSNFTQKNQENAQKQQQSQSPQSWGQ